MELRLLLSRGAFDDESLSTRLDSVRAPDRLWVDRERLFDPEDLLFDPEDRLVDPEDLLFDPEDRLFDFVEDCREPLERVLPLLDRELRGAI